MHFFRLPKFKQPGRSKRYVARKNLFYDIFFPRKTLLVLARKSISIIINIIIVNNIFNIKIIANILYKILF